MKKLLLFLTLLIAFNIVVFTQPKVSGKPSILIKNEGNSYLNAVWSPDGKSIAFSSDRHDGIWKSDYRGKNIVKITDDKGVGFGFVWSGDSESILGRSSVIENNRRYQTVKVYNTKTGGEKVILEKTRQLQGLPTWSHDDSKVAMVVANQVKFTESGKTSLKSSISPSYVTKFGEGLVVSPNKTKDEIVVFPEFAGRFIFNSRISPKGNKIVFQVSGKGLFVSDLNGGNLLHLGFGEHASWLPEGKFIIVTMVKDNGQVITAGWLYAVNIETGAYYPILTDNEIIALKPCVSPNGKKILFDNPKNGAIYILEIN